MTRVTEKKRGQLALERVLPRAQFARMQVNKYLQYIVRKESKSESDSVEECLRLLGERKREQRTSYLTLVQRRMAVASSASV